MIETAKSAKGLCATAMEDSSRIKISWDRITHQDFNQVEIAWWCIGKTNTGRQRPSWYFNQFLIDAAPGETYIVAIRVHYILGKYHPSPWAYTVVEVPQEQQKLRDEWIPVDEGLPEVGEYVIGATPIDDECWHIQSGRFRSPRSPDEIAVIQTSGGGWHYISHWMPLPVPPR